jgi:hypothetical protein
VSLHLLGYSAAALGQTQQTVLQAWVTSTLGLTSGVTISISVLDDSASAGRRLLAGACYVQLTLVAPVAPTCSVSALARAGLGEKPLA